MAFLAVLDACVLYPVELRNLLLCVAEQGLYRPLWTEKILSEMRRSILRQNPQAGCARGGTAFEGLSGKRRQESAYRATPRPLDSLRRSLARVELRGSRRRLRTEAAVARKRETP